MNILILILFGFFGGLVRAIVGLFKHKVFKGTEKFNRKRFYIALALSGIIGMFCGLLLVDDYRIVLLAGYAGTDLIQGVYGLVKK